MVIPETHAVVLPFYYMNRLHPEWATSRVVKKHSTYNLKAHQLEAAYRAIPGLSPSSKKKELLASFVEPEDSESASLEEQKEKSMANTNHFLGLLKSLETN